MITAFTTAGAKRCKVDGFVGVRWVALRAFICRLAGVGVHVDTAELDRNRYTGQGVGTDTILDMELEDGVYIVGGFSKDFKTGHCVAITVEDQRIDVQDEDEMLDLEDLQWLHQISYVRRIKLLSA